MEDVLRGKTRIDISRNLDTLPGEDGADPHWWLDPMRYKQAAELAAQELGAQYPEFSDQISENLAAFCEKLSSLQDYGEQALSDLSCRQLVTFHDGFSYFADAFSLTIAAAMEVESGSEPSAKELEEIISIVEENQIPAVFTEVNGEPGRGGGRSRRSRLRGPDARHGNQQSRLFCSHAAKHRHRKGSARMINRHTGTGGCENACASN